MLQTHSQITADCDIPNNSGKSNMVLNAKDPDYKIVGNKTIPNAIKNKTAIIALVP